MTTDFKRLSQIIAIAVSFTALQSCAIFAEKTITVKPGTKDVRTARFSPDDTYDYFRSVVKFGDAGFVRVARDESKERIRVALYNNNLDTLWSKSYKCDEDEKTPMIWASGNDINIVTQLVLDDSLSVIARKIDRRDGKLLQTKDLVKEDLEKLDDNENALVTISADSSKLLVEIAAYVDDKNDKDYYHSKLLLFANDFTQLYSKPFTMEVPENAGPNIKLGFSWGGLTMSGTSQSTRSPFAINSRGDIYYAGYEIDKSTIWESVNRLAVAETTPKKIKASNASVLNLEDDGWPVTPYVVFDSDDIITTAWHYIDGDETKGVSVGKYDFTQNLPLFNTMNTFTMKDANKLVNEDELEDYRLIDFRSLPNGETLSLLESYQIHTSYNPGMPGPRGMMTGGSTTTNIKTGPFIAFKTGAHGEKVWVNSFKKWETSLDDVMYESGSSRIVTDSSIICAYRSRKKEGVSLCEFMLSDGSIRTATLPLTFTEFAIFFPEQTVWNNDNKTGIFFGVEGRDGMKAVSLPLPERKPYVKPLDED